MDSPSAGIFSLVAFLAGLALVFYSVFLLDQSPYARGGLTGPLLDRVMGVAVMPNVGVVGAIPEEVPAKFRSVFSAGIVVPDKSRGYKCIHSSAYQGSLRSGGIHRPSASTR